jgi:cell wall-active antibiotic response 4TMS protein YvqF
VLILLGVLFLLHTMGFGLALDRFWPLILIAIGGWMLARNWGLAGSSCSGCQCARCRSRRLMGPAMLLTIGVLLQLEALHVGNLGFGRTWPVILLVVGAVKLLQGSASTGGHVAPIAGGTNAAGGPVPPTPPVPPEPPVPPTSEVHHG